MQSPGSAQFSSSAGAPHERTTENWVGAARQSLLDPERWLSKALGQMQLSVSKDFTRTPFCASSNWYFELLRFILEYDLPATYCTEALLAPCLDFHPAVSPFSLTKMLPTPTFLAACFLSHPTFHINSLVYIHTDPGKHESPARVYVTGSNGYIYCNLMILESPWKCTSECFSAVIISWKV